MIVTCFPVLLLASRCPGGRYYNCLVVSVVGMKGNAVPVEGRTSVQRGLEHEPDNLTSKGNVRTACLPYTFLSYFIYYNSNNSSISPLFAPGISLLRVLRAGQSEAKGHKTLPCCRLARAFRFPEPTSCTIGCYVAVAASVPKTYPIFHEMKQKYFLALQYTSVSVSI